MQRDKWQVAGDKNRRSARNETPVACHLSRVTCHPPAFTIIELLVVIAILGIMAALTVPVLKNFAKSDATLGASRQLLDGVARARQLAMSQRTTVYMVFVPTNFWANAGWLNSLTPAQQTAATNLCDKQLTGYIFVSLRSVGDQPGQGVPHYLAPWQTLPDDTFIAAQKFYTSNTIVDQISGATYSISEFNYTNKFPFPTETAPITGNTPYLPYLAFNYLGQLTFRWAGRLPARMNTSRLRKAACWSRGIRSPKRSNSIRPTSRKIRPATASTPTTSSTLTG